MRYTKFGSTGMDVSAICLGGMSFGDPALPEHDWTLREPQTREIVKQALDAGINFFDTANIYSGGTSEKYVGRALADMANRDEVVIATKVAGPTRRGPNGYGLSRKAILAEIDNSLRRLGTDYVDLYIIHRWDHSTPIEETIEALNDVVRSGKARYIGASAMYAWQLATALATSEQHGWARFVSMQDAYNLLYREEEREMHPLCADRGLAVTPFSPLARGKLTRPWSAQTEREKKDAQTAKQYGATLYQPEDEQIVTRTLEVANRLRLPPAQVALAWLLSKPVVTAPIIGASKPHHLTDAIAALDLQLSDDDIAALEEPYRPHPIEHNR
ncbi:aldo/keto reductase [Solwaraspora sp. WMMB335]|uniref:aldo/keto reductase n=1 Tax=Solwaraspora sp. WMMB335 TaxID=3404118 RepID=UPI003B92ED1C